MDILIIYLVLMTAAGIMIMYADKQRARKKKWRIRESTLFAVSLLGGSLGTWLGMYMFRHKTKHWYFVIGMPLIFFIHCGLIYFCIKKGVI